MQKVSERKKKQFGVVTSIQNLTAQRTNVEIDWIPIALHVSNFVMLIAENDENGAITFATLVFPVVV
jgi:hypothetical protein